MAGTVAGTGPGARGATSRGAGPRVRALGLAALCAATLAGCASTDELYAEYDAALCPVVAVPTADGTAVRYVERESGEAVAFPPAVYFGYDSDALDGWARLELDAAAELLNRHPELNVLLTGFTSKLGSRAYNLKLANRRARRVVDYLFAEGIARRRILSQPIGQGLPEFTRDERVANAVNRRVGLTLLDRAGRPVVAGYEEPTLERGRERVGPDWPPNEVPKDLRADGPVGSGRGPGSGSPPAFPPAAAVPAPAPADDPAPRAFPGSGVVPRPPSSPAAGPSGPGVGPGTGIVPNDAR